MEIITLRNGVDMPKLGYGVFQIAKDDTACCVADAIETGYRHIDTAQSYFNESEVGDGIKASGIDRKELFVTTKVWLEHYGYEQTLKSVEVSLRKRPTTSTCCCSTSRSPTCTAHGTRSRSSTRTAWCAPSA